MSDPSVPQVTPPGSTHPRPLARPPRFALLGVAGFVAPRHLEAIRSVGGELVAALDPHDSVGILDRYFPEARYFREFERLDRYVDKARRTGQGIDYVSICTPNYLHDAHVRWALRSGANAICEKPLVINPWNVAPLDELGRDVGRKVHPVLQLRHHPAVQLLRERTSASPAHRHVALSYVTPRGAWYASSWKGSEERSGGVVVNIGVHFLDLLLWVFGQVLSVEVTERSAARARGRLELERASVDWLLSIDREDLPAGSRPFEAFRSLTIDQERFDFSTGFSGLHDAVYREVLRGRGYGPLDALPAIRLTRVIRTAPLGVVVGGRALLEEGAS